MYDEIHWKQSVFIINVYETSFCVILVYTACYNHEIPKSLKIGRLNGTILKRGPYFVNVLYFQQTK